SMYGYESKTSPNLDKLSEDSVVFKNAISPAIWTILVHGGIFTGNYVSTFDPEHSNKGLKQEDKTFVELLRNNGYNTAGFVSSAWIKNKYGFGQGFNIYKDRMDFLENELTYDKFSMKGAIFTFIPKIQEMIDIDTFRSSEEINQGVLKWLEKNKDSSFFLFLHYIGPHVPYSPSQEFREKFTEDARSYEELEGAYEKSTGLKRYGNVSEDVVDALIGLYDAEIAELDYNVNILLEGVKEFGLKDNTIIVITSDSGEEFYDHGYFKHSRTLYQELVHVPLLIYYPKKFEPTAVDEFVSTIDIFPTVFDIVGIEVPKDIDGVSLVPLIENSRSYEREFVKSELFGLPGHETKQQTAIFHNEWKLLEVEPEVETIPSGLYNLRTDPKEKKNLYNVFPEKKESLILLPSYT
ncbi:MAG TPA: sulfatase, partial [archaeon]|nr:sulfatase [archaeon]